MELSEFRFFHLFKICSFLMSNVRVLYLSILNLHTVRAPFNRNSRVYSSGYHSVWIGRRPGHDDHVRECRNPLCWSLCKPTLLALQEEHRAHGPCAHARY